MSEISKWGQLQAISIVQQYLYAGDLWLSGGDTASVIYMGLPNVPQFSDRHSFMCLLYIFLDIRTMQSEKMVIHMFI